ncbi:MAG: sigma-70 family RNA polymerase sigma factor [Chloroflexi bacterium]|nr:sigma-70 family RNA polymerase sigma factor [Chloroflexota bacterium]
MSNTEIEWLQQARQGNDEAFALLVETYQTPVFNLCYRMLGDPQEAEDAAQESFWRAYQAIQRYDPQRSFITWLLSIAAHYCIDQQRRRKLPSFSIDEFTDDFIPDNSPDPEFAVSQNEEQRLLHQLLADLGPQDRAAIVLRYWYDFSEDEISKALSMSVSAVKSRLHRARHNLAQRWPTSQQVITSKERKRHESPAF